SIDWLCWPRFDSGACFAALLGAPDHGFWSIAPTAKKYRVARRYRERTLVMETEFQTPEGRARLVDFMPGDKERNDIVRLVEGLEGKVRMCSELALRFDYGLTVPWVQRSDGGIVGVAGPNAVKLFSTVPTHGENFRTLAEFELAPGEQASFVLS